MTDASGAGRATFRTFVVESTQGEPTMSTTALHTPPAAAAEPAVVPVVITRRRVDRVLIGFGALAAVVFAVAGGLLLWGHNFSSDYVSRELGSQNITFPDAAALTAEGRTDLLSHAGNSVNSGNEAEAYASYINGHLQGIADGQTYADLGTPQRAATAAVAAAQDSGASQATIDDLQAKATALTAQRTSLFQGETLRGLLLSAYAWSTVGMIAGIAAIAAFVASAVAIVLVVLGMVHLRRMHAAA
jgi:branched-subunit amino acid transport protein